MPHLAARPYPPPLVALYTVQGGGHVVPQPRFRFGRLFGRTTRDLDMPVAALEFFRLLPAQRSSS